MEFTIQVWFYEVDGKDLEWFKEVGDNIHEAFKKVREKYFPNNNIVCYQLVENNQAVGETFKPNYNYLT